MAGRFAGFRSQPVLPRVWALGYVSTGMDALQPASAARPLAGQPLVLWVGPAKAADLRLARSWVGELALVYEAASAAEAIASPPPAFVDRSPAVILLASDAPGRWSLEQVLVLVLRWPLAPIVAVAGGLVDGRRRSGPLLPGIEEVSWHDLPGRLAWWLAERAAGRPGTLGLPGTVRREDRILEADTSGSPAQVSVAAGTAVDLDGLADLVTAAGAAVVRRSRGRPPLDEPAPVLVWDVGHVGADQLAWVRMLSANRPALRIVLFDSFPRPDTTLAAIQAGAGAVLGRPASAEALAGTLARLAAATGLSLPGGAG